MGTLVRLEPPGPRLRRELAARFGLSLSPREADSAMRTEIAYYRRHMHGAGDAAAVSALRLGAAEALRSGLPGDRRLPEASSADLVDALLASLRFTPYPDALPALATARAGGLRLVAVSNWDGSLPELLDRVGVSGHLDGVITSAAAGAAKPDPAIFHAALALVDVPAAEAVHIGDSLAEDVAGARAAGVSAVWLDRLRTGTEIDVPTITSLSDLHRLA
jgi:putative hydrolase of the HAD superfamily